MKIAIFSTLIILLSSQLLYVEDMFRHGARHTVLEVIDHNDTKVDEGQLTGVGMRQHFNLGRYLREQYVDALHFINSTFDHRQIQIFSTQKNRTIQSALSHLYGLYPDNFGSKLPQNITTSLLLPPYQNAKSSFQSQYALPYGASAFPVHDAYPFFTCPLQSNLIDKTLIEKASIIAVMDLEYTPFFVKMTRIFKLKVPEANLAIMLLLYENQIAYHYMGHEFPADFNWNDLMNLRHLSQYFMILMYEGMAGKAKSTLLFKKILSDFDAKILNPESKLKWTVLSAHDVNIAPTLVFLNISSTSCIQDKWRNQNLSRYINCQDGPDYAANLLFQLHNSSQPIVKVKYNGKYVNLCGKKQTSCSYSEWKQRLKHQFVNEVKQCGLTNHPKINIELKS